MVKALERRGIMDKNNQMGMTLQMPMIDVIEVIETRVLDFNKEFSFNYCDEVAYVLDKLMKYDEIMETPKEELTLRITISSPGGYVFALMKVMEKIELMKSKGYFIHTHVSNYAMSCGFILYCTGNRKTMSPFATIMNHQASSMSWGTVKEQEIRLENLKKEEELIQNYLRENTRMSEEEIQKPYVTNTDIYYTAQESVDAGITDEIKMY